MHPTTYERQLKKLGVSILGVCISRGIELTLEQVQWVCSQYSLDYGTPEMLQIVKAAKDPALKGTPILQLIERDREPKQEEEED